MIKQVLLCMLSSGMIYATNMIDRRPWGFYEIIADTPQFKIKRLVVLPHKRLSLQRHQHRAEHWVIVEGTGVVTLNNEHIEVNPGSTIHVHMRDIHRIENTGETELVFVEVQTGTYFGEDDIERLEDDFGRK